MHCQKLLEFHDLILNLEPSESKFQVIPNSTVFILGKATYIYIYIYIYIIYYPSSF